MRKTIGPSTIVPPNTVDSANKGVSEALPPTESAEDVNIPQGSEFETEFAQASLGTQPHLPNVSPNFDMNIPIVGGYSEDERATSNDDVGPSDKSLLRSFRFYRARSIALGQGEMTPTLDDVEQLVGLPADGDATVIGGTWGFLAILEIFENNLLQDLNVFKSLKAGGAGNSLSLKKLKKYYAYRLEKALSDGTAAAAKKNGLTTRYGARAYMLYVLRPFLFPTKKGTNVSARYLVLFAKDKVIKKWPWGSAVLAHMYYNLGATSRDDGRDKKDSPNAFKEVTFFYAVLASPDHVQPYYPNRVVRQFNREQGIPTKQLLTEVFNLWNTKDPKTFNPKYEWDDWFSSQMWKEFVLKKADRGEDTRGTSNMYRGIFGVKPASVNEYGDTPVHQSEDIAEQYNASHHEYASLSPNINLNDQQIITLNDHLQKHKEDKENESEANINLREALKEKILECKNLEEKNTSLEAELRQKSSLEDCKEIESLKAVNAILMEHIDMQLPPATPLVVLQSHQPVPDTTLAKKYEDLLAAHEDVKKKLIAKEDFEVWCQTLKKALTSEGMGYMGDPTFEELFEQNKRFFTIAQQGSKGDY
ncbi:hypothetical protein GIB67_023804 [Kingdonia uniflora]|uniref:Aminotransferase-like plant mobile domain-containing protein n=1 Tax=Kingdonia uniflora TaxID=39325 RepID=A0A7J7NGE1_9MAGN|nr:hypothetical protein GIB67_023804 [Kingdonia uniflora]